MINPSLYPQIFTCEISIFDTTHLSPVKKSLIECTSVYKSLPQSRRAARLPVMRAVAIIWLLFLFYFSNRPNWFLVCGKSKINIKHYHLPVCPSNQPSHLSWDGQRPISLLRGEVKHAKRQTHTHTLSLTNTQVAPESYSHSIHTGMMMAMKVTTIVGELRLLFVVVVEVRDGPRRNGRQL